MHQTVNERLQMQLQLLTAQNAQLRLIMGTLVRALGGSFEVSQGLLDKLKEDEAQFLMTPKVGIVQADGTRLADTLLLEVLTGEQAAARRADAPRIVSPAAPVQPL